MKNIISYIISMKTTPQSVLHDPAFLCVTKVRDEGVITWYAPLFSKTPTSPTGDGKKRDPGNEVAGAQGQIIGAREGDKTGEIIFLLFRIRESVLASQRLSTPLNHPFNLIITF